MRELFALLALLFTATVDGCSVAPADQAMIHTFRERRNVFEVLRKSMCAMPHIQTIWIDDDPRPAMSPDQLKHYRGLMKEIGANRLAVLPASADTDVLGPHPCSVEITAWSTGMLDSGDSKD